MPASAHEIPAINLYIQGASAVTSDIPVEFPTSPSSLDVDPEQLTRTVHYTHDGISITFEMVNKRTSLMELDSTVAEADLVPENIFKRISKAVFCSCISRKLRHVKTRSLSTVDTV